MKKYFVIFYLLFLFACKNDSGVSADKKEFKEVEIKKLDLTEKELYDKIVGSLVGSAIGDAMGAPTEMWGRNDIKAEYGYIDDLDSMIREPSPEGTWKINLPAGGTTDDTRWKELTYSYLINQSNKTLDAKSFAEHIIHRYQSSIDEYKKIKSFEPEPFEENTLKVAWLQEWAKVAKPYVEGNLVEFEQKMNKFYGGEMVCAGLLFAPAIGAFYPGDAASAYQNAYAVSIYDIGYARDITGLAAALTATGMKKNATVQDLLSTARSMDPESFFKSRLVGRTAYRIFQEAKNIKAIAKADTVNPIQIAYKMLDEHQQDMPFHAGEIYLQVMTAMVYADFDFQKTIEFLVNYGRDNDTTAAIAGGILGAFCGFEKLPSSKTKVIAVAKKELGIDLEKLAMDMTVKVIELNR